MFQFDHEIPLKASSDLKLYYDSDPEIFTEDKLSRQGAMHLAVSSTTSNNDLFLMSGSDSSKISNSLSAMNICNLSIKVLDTQLLAQLLDAAAKLLNLSKVKLFAEIKENSDGKSHTM